VNPTEEKKILLKFADEVRPVQARAAQLMAQAKRQLVASGATPDRASHLLASTLSALMKEL
jgi:predicted nucleic acid-binding protein